MIESDRRRTRKKQFWFNKEECDLLAINSQKAGLCESEYIRELLVGYKLKEKPDDRFYEYIRLLRSLANNMNQIAKKAHTLGFIDEVSYRSNVDKIILFIDEVKDKYLRDEKGENYDKR